MVVTLPLLALSAAAESWPARSDAYVTDLAGMLPEAEETRLRADLAALKADTGVAMAVLTLWAQADYDGTSSLPDFAAGVFDAWGLGDGERNDGILVLVAAEDRELRIALGAGYDQGYDVLAEDIAARFFLPGLREGAPARAIVAGSQEVMARIARPHAARRAPGDRPARPVGLPTWLPFAVIATCIAIIALRRRTHALDGRSAPRARPDRRDRDGRDAQKRTREGGVGETERPEGGRSSGGGGTGRW
jgi:uncharacterized protein